MLSSADKVEGASDLLIAWHSLYGVGRNWLGFKTEFAVALRAPIGKQLQVRIRRAGGHRSNV